MPIELTEEGDKCGAPDEVGVTEVCFCPCSRIINADLEGTKLDMTTLESRMLEAISERDTESKIVSLQTKTKDMKAVFHHQDKLICHLNEENLLFKSKISCVEKLVSETMPNYFSNKALFPALINRVNFIDETLTYVNEKSAYLNKSDLKTMANDSDNNALRSHASVNSENFIDVKEHSREQSIDFSKRYLHPLNNKNLAADSNSVASLGEKNQVICCGNDRQVNTTTKNVDFDTIHKLEEDLSELKSETRVLKVKNGSTLTEESRHHHLSKYSTPRPFLTRRSWCLKDNHCDFLHEKSYNGNVKKNVPCPFLQRRGPFLQRRGFF